MSATMSTTPSTLTAPHAGPVARLLGTAAGLLLAVSLLFAVAFDQGAVAAALRLAAGDSVVHEVFHDARHMLGFPCH